MTSLSISMKFSTFLFLILFFFRPSISDPNSTLSFSFPQFGKDPKQFVSQISLYGDSRLVGFGSIGLTSDGRVIHKKPIKLIEGKPQKLVSFSTHFSFSLPQGGGERNNNALAFVMLPSDFDLSNFHNNSFGVSQKGKSKIVIVKFSTLDGFENDDGLVRIHGGIDVIGLVSTKVRNASIVDLTLRNGNKSFAWVDYEASSKRLEVRLSQSSGSKPIDPLFWYPIDLSRMWKNEEALVGFSANSSKTCLIHSWVFEQRHVPQWMHSEPLDPNKGSSGFGDHSNPIKVVVEKKRECVTKILASMIFGVACGALMVFIGLYLWTIFGNKRPIVPEESVDFEYKKVKVVDNNKTIEDDGKQVEV